MNFKYIKLTKLAPAENPLYPTASKNEYKAGQINDSLSPPIDYWIEGFLLNEIKVGGIISVDRKIRNGKEVLGYFNSSAIKSIKGNIIETNNSIYKIEYLYK